LNMLFIGNTWAKGFSLLVFYLEGNIYYYGQVGLQWAWFEDCGSWISGPRV
jgi:hypothetical protein